MATTQVFAQQVITKDTTRYPEISFEKLQHDFGTLMEGEECVYSFKFINTGNEPLLIESAHTSCGCDVASWPKEPILPGKGGVVTYKYDSKRIGYFHKTVTVKSNSKNGTLILKVTGVVEDTKESEAPSLHLNEN